MTQPFVSVIIETVTARENKAVSLDKAVADTIASAEAQSYPSDRRETIVVLDAGVTPEEGALLRGRFPSVRCATAPAVNYLAAKNAGVAAARGEIVAFFDADCVAAPEWLENLVAAFTSDAAGVAGLSRYPGGSLRDRTFSVPDLAYVAGTGEASGFNLSNVAFRRDVLLAHPLNERIRRHGGCYLLQHQLRAAGHRVLFEKRARIYHGVDRGGIILKHFQRGYDGLRVYRLDDDAVLRGTRWVRRFGAAALLPITARRIAVDWLRLARHHRQMNVPLIAVPYYAVVGTMTRLIELVGGLAAAVGD